MKRIFKHHKSLQKNNLPFKMRHKETNREETTDKTKAELMNNYIISIVNEENFISFYPHESHVFGDAQKEIIEDQIENELNLNNDYLTGKRNK